MAESVQIAAFTGGELHLHFQGERAGEAVLALPLSRFVVKMVKVPSESGDDPAAFAQPILQAMSPYPDESLTVGCETVRETSEFKVVLAAALPESSADDIGEALDAAKVNPTKIDALALGRLRSLWGGITGGSASRSARRMVLMGEEDCISLFVLDGDSPVAVRALSCEADLRREAMLSLLEAEDFGGQASLAEIVVAGEVAGEGLDALAPVRRLDGTGDAIAGIAERALEQGTLNALPDSWREMLEESRFKAKLVKGLGIAGGIWALAVAILFGVPMVYGFMSDHQKNMSQEHAKKYRAVEQMRDKVRLVQKYSDHERGALEILKAVCDAMPEGVELNSWNFRRDNGVRISGEAEDASAVYAFKDALIDCASVTIYNDDPETAETNKLFADVVLTGPSAGKGNKQKFDIECRYVSEEEER